MARTSRKRTRPARRRAKAAPLRGKTVRRRGKAPPSRTRRARGRVSAKGRAISEVAIIAILRQIFDPHGFYPFKLSDDIGDYIKGGAAALRAFFHVANRAFQDYGLRLKPGDLANVKKVQDLVDVIAAWFRKHGYQVN